MITGPFCELCGTFPELNGFSRCEYNCDYNEEDGHNNFKEYEQTKKDRNDN